MTHSIDYCELAVTGVRALQPYQPGKPVEELQRELGLSRVVKLASNENPLGPAPSVVSRISKLAGELARYPDGNGFQLKQALAKKLEIEPAQLTLGNGSNDVLEIIARTFVAQGQRIVYSQYAFAVYPIVTQAIGAQHGVIDAIHWGHDLNAMLAGITDNTRLVFIANPNNPTGTWLSRESLCGFLDRCPRHVLVVLDEAYYEYASAPAMGLATYPDGVRLLKDYENLIVTRTFSKAYGLAGLRVGYAISNPAIADLLNRVRQPFNVNSVALAAAEAALDDDAHINKSITLNREGLTHYYQAFDKLGLNYIPSAGNFVSVDMGTEAGPLYQALLQEGVIVRPVANYAMPNHLRVTVGTKEENSVCLDALTKVLQHDR